MRRVLLWLIYSNEFPRIFSLTSDPVHNDANTTLAARSILPPKKRVRPEQ